MLRPKLLAVGSALLVVCAVGSALTRHSHGMVNVLSNICFFALAVLVLAFAAAAAGINRLRAIR